MAGSVPIFRFVLGVFSWICHTLLMRSGALHKDFLRVTTISLPILCLFATATLFADTLPIISAAPQSITVAPGSNAVLSVTASGASSYQWRFNGADISGAIGASLTVTNAQLSNSGYYVIAKNSLGWVPALPAYLSVVDIFGLVPFSNKFHSNAITVYLYNDGWFGPVTNGTATISAGPALDQMQIVPGVSRVVQNGFFGVADTSVPTVAAGQTVYYRVNVAYPHSSSQTGSNISTVLNLIAGGGTNPVPSATNVYFPAWLEWPDYDPGLGEFPPPYSTPTNQLRIIGETFTLTNTFLGYLGDLGPRTAQWRKDGIRIGDPVTLTGYSGTTNRTLTFTNFQPSDAGIYDLEYKGNNWVIGPKTVLSVLLTNDPAIIQSPRQTARTLFLICFVLHDASTWSKDPQIFSPGPI